MKIITHRLLPPIRSELHAWMAIYDGLDALNAIGYGSTEAEAVFDLVRTYPGDEFENMPDEALAAWVDDMLAQRAKDDHDDQQAQRGKDIAKGIEPR